VGGISTDHDALARVVKPAAMSGLAVTRIKRPTGSGIGRATFQLAAKFGVGRSGLVIAAPVKLGNR